ncbi:16S rRNA (guanine(527)-N(7))-methyltransferase RsmG [uncultured Methylibium sp.]|uniref:16S rRNA (guanine(527)-N(7))-methyltransferase RsmG n=1 Tax=uncultured Methylibium sp. TaxID=381093 RepID=UPI0025EBD16E|nr:16S rRNA (guanine(527)-N(7))-methyltransferase RsmG [uncultured Methylibium sp.]
MSGVADDPGLAARLRDGAEELGIALDTAQQQQLLRYLSLIVQWTRVYNLTAVRDPAQMLTQHLLDSLAVVAPLRRMTGGRPATLLDVGSGAGLPGIVVAVACPEISVTCVDAVGKKAGFIRQVGAELGLEHLVAVHARVEDVTGQWDIVVSRAFSSLEDFAHLTRRVLAPGGHWMAMKGRAPDDELAVLPSDIVAFHVEPLRVPGLDAERCIVWMRSSLTAA